MEETNTKEIVLSTRKELDRREGRTSPVIERISRDVVTRARRFRLGMDFHAPFTGRKGSSFGPPEKCSHCREFFTNSKVVHARYGEPHNTGKAGL